MNKIVLVSILIFILSCSGGNELSQKKQLIIKNSINYIKENNAIGLKECYLVNSQLAPMQFELFYNLENVNFEKEYGKDYQKELKKIENDLNNETDKYDDAYSGFSSCEKSEYIISLSRISEKYVMCYLSQENRNVTIDEILKRKYKFNSNEYYFFLIEFDTSGNIVNVFENSVIFN